MKNGLINVDKIRRVGSIVEDFLEFKSYAYLFRLITELSFLSNPNPKSEDKLVEIYNKLGNLFHYKRTLIQIR